MDTAINIGKKIDDAADITQVLFFKYDLLFVQKKYEAAKKIAYDINDFYINSGDTIAYNKLSTYKILWEIEKATGNYKTSLNWLEKYSDLSDSVNKRDQALKINDLVTKYQSEKKEKEILRLENKSKQQQLTIKSNKLTTVFLAAGLLITFLLLLVAFIILRNRKKLAKQKDQLHQQELLQKESEKHLLISNAMLEGEEKERSRLSHELHDGLGGMLTGIKLQLQSLDDENPKENSLLNKAIKQLSDAGKEMRRIAHNMMPENLIRFGLDIALQDLCEKMQSPQTYIHYYSRDLNRDMPKKEQLIIYRIIQELLNNALKHAYATEILVECIQEANHLYITVEDNGKGYDTDQFEKQKGIGLQNIYNRTKFLYGDLQIDSNKNAGTSVRIQVNVSTENILEEHDADLMNKV